MHRHPQRLNRLAHARGFTLIELIMVIAIMGIVGGMVAVFMKGPIDAYFSGGRRAALTDVADTTVRRIARDLRRTLPNSVRVASVLLGTNNCLEFIPTKTGGRYRTQGTGALTFDAVTTSFNMLGDHTTFAGSAVPSDQQIAANDLIVVYNLGISGADAYQTDNTTTGTNWTTVPAATSFPLAKTASPVETTIPITSFKFPLPSASNRFQVVSANEKMVSYVCSGGASGTLYRTISSAFTSSASCPASGAKIATNVDCTNTTFTITDSGNALNRNALVSMRLTMGDSSGTEFVTLQHQVHVDNTP